VTTSKGLKRTNFQLQDLLSPKSCRKCIWPRVIVFRVLRKPVLLEAEKAQLVVMTIACLHNFLRRSPDSAAIYTPPGTFDHEENCRVTEGSCRAMSNENMTSLFPIRKLHANQFEGERNKVGISSLFPEWRKSRLAK